MYVHVCIQLQYTTQLPILQDLNYFCDFLANVLAFTKFIHKEVFSYIILFLSRHSSICENISMIHEFQKVADLRFHTSHVEITIHTRDAYRIWGMGIIGSNAMWGGIIQ